MHYNTCTVIGQPCLDLAICSVFDQILRRIQIGAAFVLIPKLVATDLIAAGGIDQSSASLSRDQDLAAISAETLHHLGPLSIPPGQNAIYHTIGIARKVDDGLHYRSNCLCPLA